MLAERMSVPGALAYGGGSSNIDANDNSRQASMQLGSSHHEDWLGRALDAANLVSTAAQLAPIPWISPVAGIVIKLLEMVQVRFAFRFLWDPIKTNIWLCFPFLRSLEKIEAT